MLYHVVWCCIPYWLWIFTQVSVVRHVTLKHGFSDRSFRTYNLWAQTGGHGEGDGLVGSTWGFSSWGCHSVALAVVTWPCPAVCSLHPKMISLLVCSVCSVSLCIHFWPFHLGIDSWPFAMVQTNFAPRKLDGWAYYTGWPAIWVAERYLYPIYGLQQLDLYPIPIVTCPCHHGFPRLFMGFPWIFPCICCWNIPSIAQGGDIFQRWSPGESPCGFRQKPWGSDGFSHHNLNNHEDFIIINNICCYLSSILIVSYNL